MKVLGDEDPKVVLGNLRGLRNARISQRMEECLLDLARQTPDEGIRKSALIYGLGELQEKSIPVVEELIAHLDDPNPDIRNKMVACLSQGVAMESQSKVADVFVALIEDRKFVQFVHVVLAYLGKYGGEGHLDRLERIRDSKILPEVASRDLQMTIGAMRKRLRR